MTVTVLTPAKRAELTERIRLEREYRDLLLALEVTSCGTTSSPNLAGIAERAPRPGDKIPTSTPSFESSPPTSGDPSPPHVFYKHQWAKAETNGRRSELVRQMRGELEAITISQAGDPEDESSRTRRLLEREGVSPRDLALHMRDMTEAQVRKTRILHGRDPETGTIDIGRKVIGDGIEPAERRILARAYADEYGLSTRQIAPLLGISHMQVHNDLKHTRPAAPAAEAA